MTTEIFLVLLIVPISSVRSNGSPIFNNDLNKLVISESIPVGTVIGILNGSDPEGSPVHYDIKGTDFLSVNRDTGEVILQKPLDREINDTLSFEAVLEDEISGTNETNIDKNVVSVPVKIIIDDENDTPPRFLKTPYSISVAENTSRQSVIFSSIQIEDVDLFGETLEVFCSSEELNTCTKFQVILTNSSEYLAEGEIVLKDALDYNEKQLYHMTLTAYDGKFNTTTQVEIRVLDVQNLPPIFQSSLTAIVEEDAEIGTHVITVQAKDGDRGVPRPIVYDLLTNPFNYFLLDGNTGELRTAKPLDRERLSDTNGVLSLTVRAREVINGVASSDENTSAKAEVSITIRDVNDEPPKFNKKEYFITIPENTPNGSPLPNLDMTVTDTDIGNNSVFSLRLEDVSEVFSVEPSTAVGSTSVIIRLANGSLDYENPNQRKFIILVIAEEIQTKTRLSSTCTVTVEVTDVNDNAPMFEHPTYTATVNESALPGTVVTTITATDRDNEENGASSIVYELIGEGANVFNVNRKTGVITVALCASAGVVPCLDYETKLTYFLTYKATDVEGTGQITNVPLKVTVMDGNDNPPIFTTNNYSAAIDEGATKFEPQFFVKAEDKDKLSNIVYAVEDESVRDMFEIDSSTGEITVVSETGAWRVNNSDTVTFTISASDGAFSTEATVNVDILDVNNNEPKFLHEMYLAEVPEDAKIGEIVTQVKSVDEDRGINAELTYAIEKGAFNDFDIDGKTGLIRVKTKLDYDKRDLYNITVIARDAGTPMLTGSATVFVHVVNTNDKNPYFEPSIQRAEVPKDAKIGTKFYKMMATDPDINDTDVLDFAFSEPITAVDKNGKPVLDNDIFKRFFEIKKDTGEIEVANVLCRDIAAVVTLTVIVTDTSAQYLQEGKGTVRVSILDVNDVAPSFLFPWTKQHPYYVEQMQEELPTGSVLGSFTASDPDSDIHHYAIEPESEYFVVNNATGMISTQKRIDFEQVQSINFTLKAYDMGVPQLTSDAYIIVNIVNINDIYPVFEKSEYEAMVKENSPKGTFVVKVKAVDGDLDEFGRIRYDFKGGYVNDFIIDEQTGDIKVANSAALDREKVSEILLKVEASDMAPREERKSSTVPVRIKIEDVNDSGPVFIQRQYSANIVETISYSPPSPIVQLHAEDKDEKSKLRYYIVNGNDEEAFNLDSVSGILYPKRSLLHILKQFKLTVEVTDGKFTDKAVIEIHVFNANQNKPMFKAPTPTNTSVLIGEDVKINYLVIKVLAEDRDDGENGRVTYHFRVGNNDTQKTDEFSIDENTGELRTLVHLDRENKPSYELLLVARDHGTQSYYETLQSLTIVLLDVDDNKPVFESTEEGSYEYRFSIYENNAVNILLGKVHAEDADIEENAKVFYYVIRGNENNLFSVDRRDGSVYILVSLDREQNSSHEFFVKATNNANYNSAPNEIIAKGDPTIARIQVVINDENDNAPYFLNSVYYGGVDMQSEAGTYVTEVTAVDLDEGENGKFHYELHATHLFMKGANQSSGLLSPSPFVVNAQTGRVQTADFVSLYSQDKFELQIVAVENASPNRQTEVRLHVWIYEMHQLARVILSRPPHEVKNETYEIVKELANATGNIVVIDDIRSHVDQFGQQQRNMCDLYMHMIDGDTQKIVTIPDVLKVIDDKYDHLKDYYAQFAIENVLPAFTQSAEEPFEPALAALVALTIVLIVGCISVIILCCCFKHWIVMEPLDMKCDMLIKKPIIDDLSTTENPLWIEQKLKLYEEQELTMQVFCEPEASRLTLSSSVERRGSDETSVVDNTYATIQHPGRRNSVNTMLSIGPGDYATLGGSVLPLDNTSSHSQQVIEAALGFQGCTFQVPDGPTDTTELLRARSELRMNHNGQPEFVSELM